MAKLLDGREVTAALKTKHLSAVAELAARGIFPNLAIVRIGEREDDVAYEKGAVKRCEAVNVAVRKFSFSPEVSQEEVIELIGNINGDASIHGALLFRPFPKHMDEDKICNALSTEKDVDGITDGSLAGVFSGRPRGFAPCTARACMAILEHFGVELKGKRIAVIGRSLVVGKPVSMMLMGGHATVTVCHTRTIDMPAVCRDAEILIVAAGRAKVIDRSFCSPGQIVIDVGINIDEAGNLCGDVDFKDCEPVVGAITPVPGGVGTVTTSILVEHVIEAARGKGCNR
ncbi:MAG: bifunctional 5,10-methylenetetrahydrofolate dehydrogenase/5,10-methenyltetrahydrofolate cyclohydrolase [Synergistaceae bacterium]|jgi:methylenetetrahydrofolate dehydrogenase (NADP+)/methenyltetrahydrofolate cyclohydrolase|nr:bifunctional 5,10-methylenetetrahydrofolate dehydrogenase/5,10-methenyltetrahydrofolate cyclohydrolase [Synergistaceae bacterium]